MFIGANLNVSEDALDFGDYSDRWINTFIARSRTPLWPITRIKMSRDLQAVMEKHWASLEPAPRPWGWKEPRSIYLLQFFHNRFPGLKFLHVVRDGRDMAFSTNQNQLVKHGHMLLDSVETRWSQPMRSIALWSRVNLQAADYGENHLRGQYLCVRFEDCCSNPVPIIQRIFDFLGLGGDVQEIAQLEVKPPESLGRWRHQDEGILSELHRIGGVALQKFGYWIPE
jgi:hypothetical protein